jgi:rhodanese-related sulfurtransferase
MSINTPSAVTETPAAKSDVAYAHFSASFTFETDCWDVHAAMSTGIPDFVLLDVRSSNAYREGHAPRAVSLPHREIIQERMAEWPRDTLFVVYCAGPHCNGANRAAARLASLQHPVKLMLGGITGWLDEGFELKQGTEP